MWGILYRTIFITTGVCLFPSVLHFGWTFLFLRHSPSSIFFFLYFLIHLSSTWSWTFPSFRWTASITYYLSIRSTILTNILYDWANQFLTNGFQSVFWSLCFICNIQNLSVLLPATQRFSVEVNWIKSCLHPCFIFLSKKSTWSKNYARGEFCVFPWWWLIAWKQVHTTNSGPCSCQKDWSMDLSMT